MAPSDDEFEQFVTARYRRLVGAAVLLGCRGPEAEDAAQDALMRCWASWSRVVRADDSGAYVYRVLVNGITRGRRRRWRGEVPHADPVALRAGSALAVSDSDIAAAVANAQSVRSALARLGREHREVLVLRYYADLSERQTAQVLGVPRGTVKSRAARGLAALSNDPSLRGVLAPTHEEE